ncbi:MAG: hypothetical protein HDS40_03585 [Bacteroides sp.]|nr:hypothetical protein [Bacteroides sp.]MBD5271323.1 hypothetical protein [Bacteroides sp.]
MSVFSGKAVVVARPIAEIYARVSDLGQYREMVEQLPAEAREKLQGVEFRGDSLKMDAPGVGELVFNVTERVPSSHVGLEAVGSPVPLKLAIDLEEVDAGSTRIIPRIDVQLPAMLKPFIGPKLQEGADRFGEVFTGLFRS